VGLVFGVETVLVAAGIVGSVVRVADAIGVVVGRGAAQAAMVARIRIVIRIVLKFVFMMTAWTFSPLRELNLRKGKQDHQISPTVNPSGNGSPASTT
jgi:hypothetical protein